MIKQIIHYPDTNSVEATWVDSISGVVTRCHSYSDRQMDMLLTDLGDEATQDHLDLIEFVLLNQQPLPPEPEPVPVVYSCSPWQIRKALNNLTLRTQVEQAVMDGDQEMRDGWAFATEFRSDDPFVLDMGATLGKTPEETAELIRYAATL